MAKNYTVQFGSGDPRGFTGLAPTFLIFYNLATGTTNTPPSIAETITGKTGIYSFAFGTTQPISFLLDAATTSPGNIGRYVTGQLDPADRADEYGNTMVALGQTTITQLTNEGLTLVAVGNTQGAYGATLSANFTNFGSTLVGMGNSLSALGISNFALGNTLYALIGTTADSFGSTLTDPTSVFGFLKRAQELAEGNQTYTKATGILDLFSRGSSTLLREKTISDTSSTTTKT